MAEQRELTERQKRFVEEYLVDFNARQAAKRAGFSEHTAGRQGTRLIATPHVKAEIEKRRQVLQKKTGITQEQVLKELAEIAFAKDLPLKGSDKMKALEMLSRHLGLLDNMPADTGGTLSMLIQRAYEKRRAEDFEDA